MPGVTHYDSSALAKFHENMLSMFSITVLKYRQVHLPLDYLDI